MKPTLIPNASIMLRHKGTFYNADLYKHAGLLYAKHGRGFIMPEPGKRTSVDGITWNHMFFEGSMHDIQPDARNARFVVATKGATE